LNQTFKEIQSHARYSSTTGNYHWDYQSVERELKEDLEREADQEEEHVKYYLQYRYVPETLPPYSRETINRATQLIRSIAEDVSK
jgi:hypothetical protein